MKGKKRFAALLLSFLMVFLLLPVSALADSAPIVTTPGNQPSVATNAPTTGSLTITKKGSQSTFQVYRLFDMTVASGADVYSYGASAKFSGFFSATGAPTVENIFGYDADALAGLTKDLRAAIAGTDGKIGTGDDIAADGTASADKSNPVDANTTYSVAFNNLPLGYYLVIETATNGAKTASKDFLVSVPSVEGTGTSAHWIYDVTANCKDSDVTTDKTITGSLTDVTTHDLTGATRNIGDTVDYRLDADVPNYDLNTVTDITFTLHDTLSKGLTYNDNSTDAHGVKVYGFSSTVTDATAANDITDLFTITPSAYDPTDGTTLTIALKKGNNDAAFKAIVAAGYTSVGAFYSATLNEHAVIGSAGNPNEAYLTYTRGPGDDTDSEHHKTYVYTFGLEIVKLDFDHTETKLSGAVFSLLDENKNPITGIANQTTGTDGKLDFKGIKEGTYYVHEVTAPSGYSLLGYDLKVVIAAIEDNGQPTGDFTCTYYDADGTTSHSATFTYVDPQANPLVKIFATFNVLDHAGFTLPGTGGIGTTIFFVSGFAILALGGCLAFLYMKKNRKTSQHSRH